MTEAWLPWLLMLQGVLAGFDTLLNHEIIARLPRKAEARREVGIHVYREVIWAILLLGLPWFAWHGAAAGFIAALLATEVCITAWDEYVENRTRVLPQNERVLHVFLTVNFGAILATLGTVLPGWAAAPSQLLPTSYGWLSWLLSAFGLSSAAWSLRDLIASRSLARR